MKLARLHLRWLSYLVEDGDGDGQGAAGIGDVHNSGNAALAWAAAQQQDDLCACSSQPHALSSLQRVSCTLHLHLHYLGCQLCLWCVLYTHS